MVDHVYVSLMCCITYIIVYVKRLYRAYLCILRLCQCMALFPWRCNVMTWICCYKKHPPMRFYALKILIMNELLLGIYRFRFIFIQKKDRKRALLFLFIFEICCCLSLFNTYGTPDCQMCQQQLGTFLGTHTP